MKSHIAEFVSPGHPDRLADAIVESIVDLAVGRDADALVGVECAYDEADGILEDYVELGIMDPDELSYRKQSLKIHRMQKTFDNI